MSGRNPPYPRTGTFKALAGSLLSLLSFRFIRQLFPGGEEMFIYKDDREEMTIVVEDAEVDLL